MLFPAFSLPIFRRKNEKANSTRFKNQVPFASISDVETDPFKNQKRRKCHMAGERRVPNYRKMYPSASEEVIAVLRQSKERCSIRNMISKQRDLR